MKILVQQIKNSLKDFVSELEGTKREKNKKFFVAMNSMWNSTRKAPPNDLLIFDVAWSKCDITLDELAALSGSSKDAVEQSLYRVRQLIIQNLPK
jgi:hypothetical protein